MRNYLFTLLVRMNALRKGLSIGLQWKEVDEAKRVDGMTCVRTTTKTSTVYGDQVIVLDEEQVNDIHVFRSMVIGSTFEGERVFTMEGGKEWCM